MKVMKQTLFYLMTAMFFAVGSIAFVAACMARDIFEQNGADVIVIFAVLSVLYFAGMLFFDHRNSAKKLVRG